MNSPGCNPVVNIQQNLPPKRDGLRNLVYERLNPIWGSDSYFHSVTRLSVGANRFDPPVGGSLQKQSISTQPARIGIFTAETPRTL